MTVIVVTGIDPTADSVIRELNEREVPVARFDLADFPHVVGSTASFVGGELAGVVETSSRTVDLRQVRAVYWRRPNAPVFEGLSRQDAEFAAAEARFGFAGVLQALTCLYVNHPRRQQEAEYKPIQLRVAFELGFDVPPTIISNKVDDILTFIKDHEPVVYKPLSSTAYEVDGTPYAPWVRQASVDEVDQTVAGTAHMFQAKVDKTADIRTTMVGRRVFSVQIESPYLDWRERYDEITRYQVIDTPEDVALKCRAYLDRFGLTYGCFDFGLTRNGRWRFYECNPAGQWGWLESEADVNITAAFADVLEKGTLD